MRYLRTSISLLFAMFVFCVTSNESQGLPDPATGGKDDGPVDILILRGHAEMNFGKQPPLDETYQKKLQEAGFRVTTAPYSGDMAVAEWKPLSLEYLRQFNVVVYLNPSPAYGGGYFDAAFWRGGPYLLQVRENWETLRQYVEAGGGLFIVPALEELCMRTSSSHQRLFQLFDMDTTALLSMTRLTVKRWPRLLKSFPSITAGQRI